MSTLDEKLAAHLARTGRLSEADRAQVRRAQEWNHAPLGATLIELRLLDADQLATEVAHAFGLATWSGEGIDRRAATTIGQDACRKYKVFPVRIEAGRMVVAMTDPTNLDALTAMEFAARMPVEIVIASGQRIDEAILAAFEDVVRAEIEQGTARTPPRALPGEGDEPVVRLANMLLIDLLKSDWSHLRVEVVPDAIRVLVRCSGGSWSPHPRVTPEPKLAKVFTAVIERLELMAALDTLPGDVSGTIYLRLGDDRGDQAFSVHTHRGNARRSIVVERIFFARRMEEHHHAPRVADALTMAGKALYDGHADEAEATLRMILPVIEREGPPEDLADALHLLGQALDRNFREREARVHLTRALELVTSFGRVGRSWAASLLLDLGSTYEGEGMFADAVKAYAESLARESAAAGDDAMSTLEARLRLASALGEVERDAEALAVAEGALALVHDLEGPGTGRSFHALGAIAAARSGLGHLDEAARLAAEVIALAGDVDTHVSARMHWLTAEIQEKRGDNAGAAAIYRGLLDSGQFEGSSVKAVLARGLARTLGALGHGAEARASLEVALTWYQRMRAPEHPLRIEAETALARSLSGERPYR
ncbi:MAG: Type fimbrial assembly, ATPase PilB [Myxococcaceae bacterium]|nr:Type fimbrial assembly, ATPase PilB [Myxococcaceae bacterium]